MYFHFYPVGLILTFPLLSAAHVINKAPVIGILSVDSDDKSFTSSIDSSYVKMMESAGAKVVPLLLSWSESTHKDIFKKINGVFIPGGGGSPSTDKVTKTAKLYWDMAIAANQAGDYFPLWGTCLGFEIWSYIAAGEAHIMSNCQVEGELLPLKRFLIDPKKSRLFGNMSNDLLHRLLNESLTPNFHHYCLTRQAYQASDPLRTYFRPLATSVSHEGFEFIANMEGWKLPFYISQWHPEMNAYAWCLGKAAHYSRSDAAYDILNYIARFYVKETEKSSHRFTDPAELEKRIIYNYCPTYTTNGGCLESIYQFH